MPKSQQQLRVVAERRPALDVATFANALITYALAQLRITKDTAAPTTPLPDPVSGPALTTAPEASS